jgi:DNA-binding beta-propeller fold protein YncE
VIAFPFARYILVVCAALGLVACGGDDDDGGTLSDVFYPTSSVVFSDQGQQTYVQMLPSIEAQTIDPSTSREFPGWADIWVHDGALLVADGEAPTIDRYRVEGDGALTADGRISFADYGASTAAFWGHLFVSPTKVYWFDTAGRTVVIWDPTTMTITRSFPFPELADRGGLTLAGPTADRSSVVRGDRAYVPFYWADWTNYVLSEDSIVLVFDTTTDTLLDVISVPCPELNFVSVDDVGTIYFSNWGYSVMPTLLDGKAKACAVRIPPGSDQLDAGWKLTFADVTEGREAATLRWIGGGKALVTVFHQERVELTPDADRYALTDSANWTLWSYDLATGAAAPFEGLGWHSAGLYGTRVDDKAILSVPSGDYASTATYTLAPDGTVAKLWESVGWQTRLFKVVPE